MTNLRTQVIDLVKGGAGSGNFNHLGRKGSGLVGGSLPMGRGGGNGSDRIEGDDIPQEIINMTFYHGTSKEENAKSIIDDGALKSIPRKTGGFLKPVENAVYISQKNSYAMIYALGGDIAGSNYHDFGNGRNGYIFEISGKDLKSIQPDEDSIGRILSSENSPPWLTSLARRTVAPSRYRKVMEGEYIYWASVGKQLMNKMSVN